MRRTINTLRSVAALAVLAAGTGCDFLPDPEFAGIERALELTIVEADRGQAADSFDFELDLKNRSESTVKACLGPSRNVSYKTTSGGGSSFDFVDHPGCVREFAIESGRTMRWRETIGVTGLYGGKVEVEIEVEIVNPRRCGGYGCAAIQIKSSNRREIL